MALNDLRFTVHRRAPWGAALFFVLAVGLAGYGVATGEKGAAIASILPGLISLALWLARPPEIEGNVAEDGIVLSRPAMLIPFDSIRQIDADFDPDEPLPPSFKLRVHHEFGVLKIPDAPDINSAAIFAELMTHYTPSGSRAVNPLLSPYLRRHEANFGAERIWTFRAQSYRGKDIHRARPWLASYLAMMVTAPVWIVIGASLEAKGPQQTSWGGLGVMLLLFSLFAAAIAWASGRKTVTAGIKGWRTSSLVITPVGLALIQGDIQGELLWDQLRGVNYKSARGFRLSNDTTLYGIGLIVDGARIAIADIYDRPLTLIHDRILRYWKAEGIQEEIEL